MLTVEEVGAADPGFAAVREAAQPGCPPEPVLPPARCLLARRDGRPVARASFQEADDLGVGMVGHYEAVEAEAGTRVLREAVERLDFRTVLGPMNGSTWARYRLALPGSEQPWFPSEPRNPPEYPEHFERAGFAVDSLYESRLVEDLSPPPFLERLAARLEREGFRERPFRGEEDLEPLYRASLEAFADNLYYRPLPEEHFMAMYRPMLPVLDPRLVRLVEAPDGTLAAFVLAWPDGRRVVLKTLASSPRWRNRGLGSLLTARIHEAAAQRGAEAVIHALMHVSNASVRISENTGGRLYRRYALYRRG